jgi:signal transduction histidine kinase
LATVALAVLLQGVLALSERRAAFVSAVTHELRTPLTTFRMYAEMLAEGMVPDEVRRHEYLQTLKVEADRLSHLVENVLQYARLERGAAGRHRERVALGSLLSRMESRLRERAAQAEMTLAWDLAEDAGQHEIDTDPAAVEQILFNLVDNACKYARHAADRRVHCGAVLGVGKVQLVVRDHGPGIDPQHRRRLFRPFSKSAQEAARSAPGVGLGLALCRRLAGELGGTLAVECPPQGGTAFTLSLPG